uniref:Uncharacterized protein n=1 Tax=Anguilla anguilla TaxID=7936 RepID=A0A0E9PWN0_ANGAN
MHVKLAGRKKTSTSCKGVTGFISCGSLM